MVSFDAQLNQRLANIREQGLLRELRRVDSAQGTRLQIGGQTLLNFSSNDYLGLANDPLLKEAAIKAVETFGSGSGASRLICGSLAPHHELEQTLAQFKNTEAALSFSSGYATAVGTICALLGKEDIIILDKLVHACIVDAARLCGAKIRVFTHNDLNDLEAKLKWAAANSRHPSPAGCHTLIITESIFSMDGDAAPLGEIVALKEKYGAWLMVDEAHATGLYGKHRRGLADAVGADGQIEVQMGTLGKALGASGGYICGSRTLIDYLINRARSFIFSTAPVPAAAAAAAAGIRLVQSNAGEDRKEVLWKRVAQIRAGVSPALNLSRQTETVAGEFPDEREEKTRAGMTSAGRRDACPILSAILPIIIGDENKAVEVAMTLRAQNFFVPAIRYPTVARGKARLRVTLTAAHTAEDVNQLVAALNQIVNHQS